MAIRQITKVILPQCQCMKCSSKQHPDAGQCKRPANGKETKFCTDCEVARAEDAKQASQANDDSTAG